LIITRLTHDKLSVNSPVPHLPPKLFLAAERGADKGRYDW